MKVYFAVCAVNMLCIAHNLPSIIFVSVDKGLNIAASIEGLVIENSNNHPLRNSYNHNLLNH
jgi:lipid-binding SYLF domain-containing protein